MAQYVILKKENFNEFITQLARIKKVAAPVKKGSKSYVFDYVSSGEEVSLEYIPTIIPPKKYLLPKKETIVEYDKTKNNWEPVIYCEDIILFGVHTCDLAGMQSLNIVFSEKPNDYNYLLRKDRITIIGLECNKYCDEFASCAVVDNHFPNGGYDLFFTELEKSFIVHVNTVNGEDLLDKTGMFAKASPEDILELEQVRTKKRDIFKDEVSVSHADLKPLFDNSFDSHVWKDLSEKCLSCGNCTMVCPTCYCYDIEDEINLDLNTGQRIRKWDSCQNSEFASVAGGESFREERGDRQRHRFMRKFKYPITRYRRYFCTGCGRCSRTCMAGIDLKETIEALAAEQEQK